MFYFDSNFRSFLKWALYDLFLLLFTSPEGSSYFPSSSSTSLSVSSSILSETPSTTPAVVSTTKAPVSTMSVPTAVTKSEAPVTTVSTVADTTSTPVSQICAMLSRVSLYSPCVCYPSSLFLDHFLRGENDQIHLLNVVEWVF